MDPNEEDDPELTKLRKENEEEEEDANDADNVVSDYFDKLPDALDDDDDEDDTRSTVVTKNQIDKDTVIVPPPKNAEFSLKVTFGVIPYGHSSLASEKNPGNPQAVNARGNPELGISGWNTMPPIALNNFKSPKDWVVTDIALAYPFLISIWRVDMNSVMTTGEIIKIIQDSDYDSQCISRILNLLDTKSYVSTEELAKFRATEKEKQAFVKTYEERETANKSGLFAAEINSGKKNTFLAADKEFSGYNDEEERTFRMTTNCPIPQADLVSTSMQVACMKYDIVDSNGIKQCRSLMVGKMPTHESILNGGLLYVKVPNGTKKVALKNKALEMCDHLLEKNPKSVPIDFFQRSRLSQDIIDKVKKSAIQKHCIFIDDTCNGASGITFPVFPGVNGITDYDDKSRAIDMGNSGNQRLSVLNSPTPDESYQMEKDVAETMMQDIFKQNQISDPVEQNKIRAVAQFLIKKISPTQITRDIIMDIFNIKKKYPNLNLQTIYENLEYLKANNETNIDHVEHLLNLKTTLGMTIEKTIEYNTWCEIRSLDKDEAIDIANIVKIKRITELTKFTLDNLLEKYRDASSDVSIALVMLIVPDIPLDVANEVVIYARELTKDKDGEINIYKSDSLANKISKLMKITNKLDIDGFKNVVGAYNMSQGNESIAIVILFTKLEDIDHIRHTLDIAGSNPWVATTMILINTEDPIKAKNLFNSATEASETMYEAIDFIKNIVKKGGRSKTKTRKSRTRKTRKMKPKKSRTRKTRKPRKPRKPRKTRKHLKK
uniref:Uncharacterized protein n=1 Tax=viral metagenome TaxID=1070528 RepID=A0A6C0IEU1_9ZZZZ